MLKKLMISLSVFGLAACAGMKPVVVEDCPKFTVPGQISINRDTDTVWVEQPLYSVMTVQYAEPAYEQDLIIAGTELLDAAVGLVDDTTGEMTDPSKRRVGVYTSRADMLAEMRSLTNEIKRFQIPENIPAANALTNNRARFTSSAE